ncbi:MAG: hypothetical protein IT308_01765 [Anaerolineaceae bacterium]|nr:hypothetical protein [Anaerolineaceae bacterium]
MLYLDLTEQEHSILTQLLENCISDLRVEIVGTDNMEYKKMLHQRKKVLTKLHKSMQQYNQKLLPEGEGVQ